MRMHKEMTNAEVARLLRGVAAAYEIKGKDSPNTRFRVIAYERAADSIERSTVEVKDLWEDGKLGQVPGIGTSMAEYLDELFKTGKVRHFEKLLDSLPEAMFELLDIPGIGAKRAYKLVKELGITKAHGASEKLLRLAEKGRIRTIEGFGEQSEKEIIDAIQGVYRKTKRFLLPFATEVAENILEYLRKNPRVKRADPLGSLRRCVSSVGDVDISVASDDPEEVIKYFTAYKNKSEVIESGEHTASILLPNGMQIDLMVQPPDTYGALLQHFTGSKEHNVALREYALKKGMSLSEYGIRFLQKSKVQKSKFKSQNYNAKLKIYQFADEKSFYNSLGMEWIPPELRENQGEIEASIEGELPSLVEVEDIKGDLHLHSNFLKDTSHDEGANSIESMVEEADRLGYEYLLFTEHNPKIDEQEEKIMDVLRRKKEYIDKTNYSRENRSGKRVRKVFNGLEIDIRPDGEVALPDRAWDFLDFAVVSVHSSFRGSRDKQTKRILRGLEHPKAKILGHPTGRRIGEREGIEVDWGEVFEFCKTNDKWLEINSWWDRLDLPDILVCQAIKVGVKLVISTDSHATDQMVLMRYGVSVARRGWAEKGDIVNTLGYNDFTKEVRI
ncbi:MAG: PHP domain-containing protein [Candidatus Blackburnbacteria bacterium]|nr:PHP domain-containing protein [Candidatus Blackburnbacteria bacterium]